MPARLRPPLLLLASIIPAASATQAFDVPVLLTLRIEQTIDCQQSENLEPRHTRSTFSFRSEAVIESDDAMENQAIVPIPEIALPMGALGTFPGEEFTVLSDRPYVYSSSFVHQSQVDDTLEKYPPGNYVFTYRSATDACVLAHAFERTGFLRPETIRTRVLNETWRDGILCLPPGNAYLRWRAVLPGVAEYLDTEETTTIRLTSRETGAIVFEDLVANPETAAGQRPVSLLLFDQQGVDLGYSPLAAGQTYDATITSTRFTSIEEGDRETVDSLTFRLSFQVYIDPLAPAPSKPEVRIHPGTAPGTIALRWSPDPSAVYFITKGLPISEILPLAPVIVPQDSSEIVFTTPLSEPEGYYRVFAVPK